MPKPSAKQRKYLRRLAHSLDPVARVGKAGVTDAVVANVRRSLNDHELIKIKFVEHKDEKKTLFGEICERADAAPVGLIGNVAILYRENEDEEKRQITLPRS